MKTKRSLRKIWDTMESGMREYLLIRRGSFLFVQSSYNAVWELAKASSKLSSRLLEYTENLSNPFTS